MPSETSDIKQFLEIARRKDAKCMSFRRPISFRGTMLERPHHADVVICQSLSSRTDKESHKDVRDQVQDQVQTVPVHAQVERFGQGG